LSRGGAALIALASGVALHRFLVLELIEVETLADLLVKRGALPVEEAPTIAKQICEALEVAHEKGIVHRDLKPANAKITPNGTSGNRPHLTRGHTPLILAIPLQKLGPLQKG
jgi:serine/threonine protein kinase